MGCFVGYDFGLQFGLRSVSKNTKGPIDVLENDRKNLFYGIFDNVDTDFGIVVQNHSNHQIRFGISLDGSVARKEFIARPGLKSCLKALENNGKHFHFLSQELDEGKMLVGSNAKKRKVCYTQAAIDCSRITIDIGIAKSE